MNDFNEKKNLDVLQNIEFGLCEQYRLLPKLTDAQCIFALENAKIATKKDFGFAKNENVTPALEAQGIIAWVQKIGKDRINNVNNLTLKEYISCVDQVLKSVKRHSAHGRRGYYDFIREFIEPKS